MFRMTRREWLAQFFRFRPRAKPKREPREKAVKHRWIADIPGQARPAVAMAYTKSEARGQIKRELGLDRLPVGTVIRAYGLHRAAI